VWKSSQKNQLGRIQLRISFERLFQPLSPIIRLHCAPLFPAFTAVEIASVPVFAGFTLPPRQINAARDVTKFSDEDRGAVVEHTLDIILSNPDQLQGCVHQVRSHRVASGELRITKNRVRAIRSRSQQNQIFTCL